MTEQYQADLAPADLEAAGALGGSPDPGYTWPDDPQVVASLEHWQDLKVGVLIHWGIYTYIGQGGSWSLHRENLGWFTDKAKGFPGEDDATYQSWYYDQVRSFTGEDFDASEWASACARAGIRYGIFTTKHHDGFCLYDSHYTNLKATSEDCGLRRDVLREVVDAFREHGIETGAYFSKADWSRPEYWDRSLPISDRYHNYDISARPRAWQRFTEFTHDQIEEILRDYGPFNVLWLDAGWVREPEEPIDIDRIAQRAREIQPGILVVDREVHGPHENYRTPEQAIPDNPPDFPWESCITVTKEWCALAPDEAAKPTRDIIRNLVRIISGGGNYLIGIGPDATGRMIPSVRRFLDEFGAWMAVCGDGIYGTRRAPSAIEVGSCADVAWHLTAKPGDGSTRLFAFGLPQDRESDSVPACSLRVRTAVDGARLLGGAELDVRREGGWSVIDIPASPTPYAVGVELMTN